MEYGDQLRGSEKILCNLEEKDLLPRQNSA